MNKNILITIIVFVLFVITPSNVNAEASVKGFITKNDTLFTSKENVVLDSCFVKVNGKYSSDYAKPGKIHCLDNADEVTITNFSSPIPSTVESCTKGYYNASFTNTSGTTYTGYVCADNVQANIDVSKYAEEFAKAGFPESYFERLAVLKEIHPNWVFTAFKTNLDWNEVVKNESVVGISYIQVTDLEKGSIYLSLEEGSYDAINKNYIVKEGTNWYAANSKTVSYYLDPRNFLSEKEIFMFENLGYNPNLQTLEAIQNVLKDTDLYNYANTYLEAATYNGNNINPVHLAASSKQEVVLGDGKLSGSADGTGKINDVSYYNVYNLGAFSNCENPVMCAIDFASGYIQSGNPRTTYDRPWTTIEASIKGGAINIAESYINQNQNTLYFKKWNVTNNIYGNYSNQYMTNIKAPISEGKSAYDAYSKIEGLVDSQIEFIIPVYENMPEYTVLPSKVDEEEKNQIEEEAKEEIKEQTSSIVDIINASGYKYNGDYLSEIKIGTSAGAIISKINNNDEKIKVTVTTTDDAGATKELIGSSKIGTGNIINIESGEEKKSFRIVINGDVSGDGIVSAVDYVKIYKYIMSAGELSGSYKLAADINQDGNVSAVDYVKVYKYIMDGGDL